LNTLKIDNACNKCKDSSYELKTDLVDVPIVLNILLNSGIIFAEQAEQIKMLNSFNNKKTILKFGKESINEITQILIKHQFSKFIIVKTILK